MIVATTEGASLLAAQAMSLPELLQFLAAGLAVVLTTLSLLALFSTAMGAAFHRLSLRAKASTRATPEESTKEELSSELLAVIAAAVAVAIDRPHRVVHVGRSADDAWALERRFQHHSSHAVRRRDQK